MKLGRGEGWQEQMQAALMHASNEGMMWSKCFMISQVLQFVLCMDCNVEHCLRFTHFLIAACQFLHCAVIPFLEGYGLSVPS